MFKDKNDDRRIQRKNFNYNIADITNPHDKAFKQFMEISSIRRDFFDSYLPPDLKSEINLATLRTCKGDFIDPQLNDHAVDCLFSAEYISRVGSLLIHIEHQSTHDPLMPFRVPYYKHLIIDDYIKQFPHQPLPIIFSTVFYHGRQRRAAPGTYYNLFGLNADLAKKYMNVEALTINIHDIPDEALITGNTAGVVQYFFKHIYEKDFLEYFNDAIISKLQELETTEDGHEIVIQGLTYVWKNAKISDRKRFYDKIHQHFSEKTEKEMGTMVEWFFEQGLEKGIQQGMQQGIQKGRQAILENIALEMLTAGIDLDTIKKITRLTEAQILSSTKLESPYQN